MNVTSTVDDRYYVSTSVLCSLPFPEYFMSRFSKPWIMSLEVASHLSYSLLFFFLACPFYIFFFLVKKIIRIEISTFCSITAFTLIETNFVRLFTK